VITDKLKTTNTAINDKQIIRGKFNFK